MQDFYHQQFQGSYFNFPNIELQAQAEETTPPENEDLLMAQDC